MTTTKLDERLRKVEKSLGLPSPKQWKERYEGPSALDIAFDALKQICESDKGYLQSEKVKAAELLITHSHKWDK